MCANSVLLHTSPMSVLDFQSLNPSIMIVHNLCCMVEELLYKLLNARQHSLKLVNESS